MVLPLFMLFLVVLYLAVTVIAWQEKRTRQKGPSVLLIPRGNPELICLMGDLARFLAFAAPESVWYVELPQEPLFAKATRAAAKRYGYHLRQEEDFFDVVLSLTPNVTSQQLQNNLGAQLAYFQQQHPVNSQPLKERL